MTGRIPRTVLVAGALLALAGCSGPGPATADRLAPFLDAGARALGGAATSDGVAAFARFREATAVAAAAAGDADTATALRALVPGRPVDDAERALAGRLLRRYVVARYTERMVGDLKQMVGFRTFAVEGRENWDAPEFLAQRVWLEARAREQGFGFVSFDGRVDELTFEGGERVFGILTHGDVQDVVGQEWAWPPWDGQIVDGRIVGRGTEDDKGPIVTALYVFAALRDSGFPLGADLRLMIANGEESSWEEIPYYLARRDPPDVTLGFDASYPVTHAQKAWADFSVVADASGPDPDAHVWQVVGASGGSGLSIIPERGEALLRSPDREASHLESLRLAAERWSTDHPPAALSVEPAGEFVRVRARGRGGHSSVPESGHNALGDLVAFVGGIADGDGAWDRLMRFAAVAIGTETDGRSLGLARTDPVLGPLTLNLALLDEDPGGRPRLRASVRVPRGLDAETLKTQVAAHVAADAALELEIEMSGLPHYVDPEGPLVLTLLDVWEEVTGEPGRPVAIGGGTQARLFPDGVDFGPSLAMQRYRGHGPDEYITIEEMQRNAELTIAALWRLSSR